MFFMVIGVKMVKEILKENGYFENVGLGGY